MTSPEAASRFLLIALLAGCAEAQPDTAASDHVEAASLSHAQNIISVSWTQRADADAAWIEYTHSGAAQWLHSPAQPREAGEHTEVLLGIPAERDVTFRIVSEVDGEVLIGPEQHAQTGPLPADLLVPQLGTVTEGASDQPYLLVSVDVGRGAFLGPFYTVILDREGEIVWYRSTPESRCTMFARPAQSGDHLLVDGSTLYTSGQLTPTITRTTLDGRHESVIEVPDMFYAWDELADSSILFGAMDHQSRFTLTRQYPDATTEVVWSCDDWMDPYSEAAWACAPNTVTYRPETGSVVWSMFETSTVAEIDLETGERLRHFGQAAGSWAFEPAESMLLLQHYPNFTPSGTLLVSTHAVDRPGAQIVREFALDEETETLREIWSHEAYWYAEYAGEATRLAGGNTLINAGTGGVIQELSPDGAVVWELGWPQKLVGRTTLIDDLYALNTWPGSER